MIGKLRGKIDIILEDKIILDVSGVGYNIYASAKTIDFLRNKLNQEVVLAIETIVREDHIHLYGFAADIEKIWFNELCRVNGVGSKMAVKILGALNLEQIILAINSEDKALFLNISGIGQKLALRIIAELKDRIKKVVGNNLPMNSDKKNAIGANQNQQLLITDALSALENLGYKRAEIFPLLSKKIADHPQITLESLITEILRQISKK